MEQTFTKSFKLSFHGKGGELFSIMIVNWLLTIITLGFYYPWAKAKQLKFIYGSVALNDDRFSFNGSGKEMFLGFIKTIAVIILIYGVSFIFVYSGMPTIGVLVGYLLFFALVPIAIHGAYRYRMSRTTWRGIRFGYRGDRSELIKNCFTWIFYSIITFGIYGSWFAINLRKYILNHIKMGSAEFEYDADGGDYFWLNIKGYFLTVFTLGIYSFWWQKSLFEFYINNLSLSNGEQKNTFRSTATAGDFFELVVINLLIIVFSLGLGYAWVVTRTMEFIAENIEIEGDIDLDAISQTEEEFNDATGEDLGDAMNLDFNI